MEKVLNLWFDGVSNGKVNQLADKLGSKYLFSLKMASAEKESLLVMFDLESTGPSDMRICFGVI